jgi:hypothetical protein
MVSPFINYQSRVVQRFGSASENQFLEGRQSFFFLLQKNAIKERRGSKFFELIFKFKFSFSY